MLPGRRRGSPIVVAGHEDAWFQGAIDDASGVAAALGLAKALVDSGYAPEGPIVFGVHCAEEYGIQDSAFDWCIGSWWQVRHEHAAWGSRAALYFNIEGTGMHVPLLVEI